MQIVVIRLYTANQFQRLEVINKEADVLVCTEIIYEDLPAVDYFLQFEPFSILHSSYTQVDTPFQRLRSVAMDWHMLDPKMSLGKSNSWKVSNQFCIFKKGIIQQVGGFDLSFRTPDAIFSELAFRILRSGGIVKNIELHPSIAIYTRLQSSYTIDDFIFIQKHRNINSKIFFGINFLFPLILQIANKALWLKYKPYNPEQYIIPFPFQRNTTISSYSAIIPTLKRYEYLDKAIYSLLNNPLPPQEIIIVDQSPEKERPIGFYEQFDPKIVKVFFLDMPGQSYSRNLAIQECQNEWILLFDDDSEAWDDMMKEHIFLLEHSEAIASTGVSLAPWKNRSYINDKINYYRISNVLDTGNVMINKKALSAVNYLDLAFNKGSGVDNDLGRRLYLHGFMILFNPRAIRTHHKASTGGLREHGSWWAGKTKLSKELPIATHTYSILRFYPKKYLVSLILQSIVAAKRQYTWGEFLIVLPLLPYKIWLSISKAKKLLKQTSVLD